MKQYLDITEVAKLVRQALRESFPAMKFSVRCSKYSGGSSMRIHWTDGPTARQVEAIANTFEGSYFDGMIDYKGSIYHTLDGEPVNFLGDFIFCNRHHSDQLTKRAIQGLIAKYRANFEAEAPELLDKSLEELADLFSRGELWNTVLFNGAAPRDSVQTLIHEARGKRCAAEFANALPSKTLARVEIAGSDGYGQSGIPAADGVEGKGYPNHEREPGGISDQQQNMRRRAKVIQLPVDGRVH